MRKTRFALASLAAAILLPLIASPAAAQASTTAKLISELNTELLYVAVPVTLVTEVALIYTVLKFRNSDESSPTRENRKLEISWTIATAIILLFVGVASYGVLANENVTHTESDPVAPEENDVLVNAEAYQWGWEFTYPEHNITTSKTIVLPANQDVYFQITSRDVLHSFAVPDMGLKQDAMPGSTDTIKTVPLETGTYQGYCTEFCGVAHSQMLFTVKVVPQDEYQQWLEEQKSQQNSSSADVEAPTGALEAAN